MMAYHSLKAQRCYENLARVLKKGRPTEREKRKKTLVEQLDDKQKKKSKQEEKKPMAAVKPKSEKRSIR